MTKQRKHELRNLKKLLAARKPSSVRNIGLHDIEELMISFLMMMVEAYEDELQREYECRARTRRKENKHDDDKPRRKACP
jgi:hypothetical protein